jgi:4-amino-4-deoxy-L-arabinose transferase-like glycosyltransferase
MVRIATTLIALIGIAFTALAAYEVTRSTAAAVMAGCLIGFLPQFDFRAASVNNDSAVAAICALVTYFIVRLFSRPYQNSAATLAALSLAMAFLCKVNAIVLLPALILTIVLVSPAPSVSLRRLTVILWFLVLVSPWLIRNYKLYKSPLATGAVMVRVVPSLVEKRPLTDPYFYNVFPGAAWRSFIGYFGWLNLTLPERTYTIYLIVILLAMIGLGVYIVADKARWRLVTVLMTIPIGSLAAMVQLNMTFPQPQGRYLFPCLSAVALLVTLGLHSIVPRARVGIATVVSISSVAGSVFALTGVIYPAYWGEKRGNEAQDVVIPGAEMKGQPPGPLAAGHRFTQSFTATHDQMSAIEVEVATYQKANRGS